MTLQDVIRAINTHGLESLTPSSWLEPDSGFAVVGIRLKLNNGQEFWLTQNVQAHLQFEPLTLQENVNGDLDNLIQIPQADLTAQQEVPPP